MTPNIAFFDIPSNLPNRHANSPFTWPVRLSLNYKKIPYTTVWATHDQVESVCKANDIPLADGASVYTFPCIIDKTDPSNVVRLMDSRAIAEYLDKAYPDPPLDLNDERTRSVEQHALKTLGLPITFLIAKHFISVAPPNAVAHFEMVAPRRWGMSLKDAMEAGGPIGSAQREGYWDQVKEGFNGFGLKEGDKWLDGAKVPAYKDFVVLGWMMMIYVSGREEGWPKLMGWDDGKWKRYWETAEEYIVVK